MSNRTDYKTISVPPAMHKRVGDIAYEQGITNIGVIDQALNSLDNQNGVHRCESCEKRIIDDNYTLDADACVICYPCAKELIGEERKEAADKLKAIDLGEGVKE